MNAFDIYSGVFDEGQADFAPADRAQLIQHIDDYAFNAMDISISREVSEQIADAHLSYEGLDEAGGEYENAFWHKIQGPLSAIEI